MSSLAPARPGPVTLIAAIGIALGALGLLLAAIMLFAAAGVHEKTALTLLLALLYGIYGGLQLTAGLGLWGVKPWGRRYQLVLSWIGLLGIPCCTVVSIPILVYLYKPEVKRLFGVGASS